MDLSTALPLPVHILVVAVTNLPCSTEAVVSGGSPGPPNDEAVQVKTMSITEEANPALLRQFEVVNCVSNTLLPRGEVTIFQNLF